MKTKRILIFSVNWLGDALFSTATIRNIRRNFPDSFIACIIPSRCYQVLKGNLHLNEIIIFDDEDRHKSILDKFKFVRFLKSKKFDLVFLLHRSFTRALITWLAGIPERIGYYTRKRGFLLTKKIMPPVQDTLHRIDYYLKIIEEAGLKVEDRYLDFFISEEEEKFVDKFLERNSVGRSDFLAVINPGGNWLPKRWPKDYWALLADRLIHEFGAKVVIAGGYADLADATDIRNLMQEKPIIVAGVFNLKHLAALAKRSDLFITGDTGPLHVANSVGAKRIIAIFGPTSVDITGPYPAHNVAILSKDVGCKIPCYKVKCMDNRCMKAITPEDVIAEVKKIKGIIK